MVNIFTHLYHYCQSRKWALPALLLLVLSLSVFFTSRLTFEEDISKIMPADEGIEVINALFDETDFADRLVILISHRDTAFQPTSSKALASYCNSFIEGVNAELDTSNIRDITYFIDQNKFQEVYDVVYDNLPLFLNDADYERIEDIIHPDTLDQFFSGIYKSLLTPGGSFIKKYVFGDPLGLTGFPLERIQAFQLDDNFTLDNGYIVTRDYKNLLVFINPAQSSKETQKNAQLISELNQLIASLTGKFPDISVDYFGGVAVAVENAQQIRRDVTRTVAIALVVLLSLIIYFFRRLSVFFYLIVPTLLGGITALGLMYLLKGEVSVIAIGIGSILLGITLDYSLHIFTHFRQYNNVKSALRDLTMPIILSSGTTSIAFMCLYIIRSEALRHLGLFAALSVFLASLFSLLVLPHLLSRQKIDSIEKNTTFLDQLARFRTNQKWLIPAILILTVIASFLAPNVQFEQDLNRVNYMSQDLLKAESKLNQLTNATRRGVYLLNRGDDLDNALEKSRDMIPLLDSLLENQLISGYSSVNSILPTQSIQQNKINQWNLFWSPERMNQLRNNISVKSEALGFHKNSFKPFEDLLNTNYIAKPITTFQPLIDLLFSEYIAQGDNSNSVMSIVRVDLDQTSNVYNTFSDNSNTNILDKGYLISRFVDILRSDFRKLVFWSLLFVFFILHLAYGRLELAMITFLPVALSWIWTLGLMTVLGLKLNIINVIITTFIFGLGIDFSIFIMRGLLQNYKSGTAHLHTYKTSILLSSITTLVGIGVMIFAKHPALRSIAGISIIGISTVVFLAFVLQPILFNWLIHKSNGQRREYPLTLTNLFKTLIIYSILVLGSCLVTICSLLLFCLFFIPKESRKYGTHLLLYYFGKFYVWISFTPNLRIINNPGEDFTKPAVIISNHQSHIDTPILFSLTPKLVLLTKSWVYQFPLYYIICRLADFFNVSEGIEKILPKIRERFEQNYHIAIFPEGSRAETNTIKRFHKGAFHLADELGADILPIYIHGTGRFLRKHSFWGQSNDITIEIGKRITPDSPLRDGNIREQTKNISGAYKAHHQKLTKEAETTRYSRRQLLENYLYKGSVLRYYTLVKIKLENYYQIFDDIIPKTAHIIDIGCGYGFMSYMLFFRSGQRTILGLDHDIQKITTANHCQAKNERINFRSGDIRAIELDRADVFILADVLHYLPVKEQIPLLDRALQNLNTGGMIIVRDGDTDREKEHKKTIWTEILSTGIGFNKTTNKLNFISSSTLREWADAQNLSMTCIEKSDQTSNSIFVFKAN